MIAERAKARQGARNDLKESNIRQKIAECGEPKPKKKNESTN